MQEEIIPTAEEFFNDIRNITYSNEEKLITFAKLHVKRALEEASEKAFIIIKDDYSEDFTETKLTTVNYKSGGVYGVYPEECTKHTIEISEDSILNSYPLNLIK